MSNPFREGYGYKVRRDYLFLNHKFTTGDRVTFSGFAYAPKEGVTRFWFKNLESGETNAWHVFDGEESAKSWADFFEEISN